VSGKLERVSGVRADGSPILPPNYAANEYEICFKCHASSSPQSGMSPGYPVPRVVNTVNLLTAFQQSNPSTHFVEGLGSYAPKDPSLPFTNPLNETWTISSIMYCTDCHDSDDSRSIGGGKTGPRGPHGSNYSPLIRQQYITADPTPYSSAAYALCYRCHNEASILSNASFKKNGSTSKGGHSDHVGYLVGTINAPCSVCHDPHGIQDTGTSGSHTYLINFDTRYVTASPGNTNPIFTDNGNHSGSCTLICHGTEHKAATHNY
jgi:hypothetical protein